MKALIVFMITLTGLLGAGVGWWNVPHPQQPEAVSPVMVCAHIGLRPEALVLAGLRPADAAAALGRLRDAGEDRGLLAAAISGLDRARTERAELIEMARAQPASREVRARLQDQESSYQRQEIQLERAKASLWSIALEGVDGQAVTVCAAVRDAVAQGLPPEAAIAPLSPEQLRQLRQLRQDGARDTSRPDADGAGAGIPPAVLAARARLASELPAMLEVFVTR